VGLLPHNRGYSLLNITASAFFRLLSIAALAVFSFGCCSHVEEHNFTTGRYISDTKNVDHLMNSSVALLDPDFTHGLSISCSGFYISEDIIMTARHCVDLDVAEDGDEDSMKEAQQLAYVSLWPVVDYTTFRNDEKVVPFLFADVIYYSSRTLGNLPEKQDLALLKLRDGQPKSKHWLKLADVEPELGSKLFGVSMPGGNPWILAEGIVSQYIYDRESMPDVNFIRVSIPIDYGSSGSALVNNKGEVVGVAHLTDRTKHNAIYVSIRPIKNFVYGFLN
jgi:hypothetical protein